MSPRLCITIFVFWSISCLEEEHSGDKVRILTGQAYAAGGRDASAARSRQWLALQNERRAHGGAAGLPRRAQSWIDGTGRAPRWQL